MPTSMSIDDFWSENREALSAFASDADEALRKTAVDAPPRFHREVQKGLLRQLLQCVSSEGPQKRPTLRLAIDSNIIVADAFAVGKGKPSFLPRTFESPYLELYAPIEIVEEVKRSLVEDLPKGADIHIAQSHARSLLAHVKLVDRLSTDATKRASELIKLKDPDDVPFLAVAIQYGSDAVLSRDMKSIGTQSEIPPWKLGKGMRAVVSFEKGSLSLALGAASATLAMRALERIAFLVAQAFAMILELIAGFLAALATGIVYAISQLPDWAAATVIGVLLVGLVGVIVSEQFRNRVTERISKLREALAPYVENLGAAARAVVEFLKDVLVLAWNFVILPVGSLVVVGAFVLLKNIRVLIAACESQDERRALGVT